jgi:hypothetical protein
LKRRTKKIILRLTALKKEEMQAETIPERRSVMRAREQKFFGSFSKEEHFLLP